jgi:hypothetical protein
MSNDEGKDTRFDKGKRCVDNNDRAPLERRSSNDKSAKLMALCTVVISQSQSFEKYILFELVLQARNSCAKGNCIIYCTVLPHEV